MLPITAWDGLIGGLIGGIAQAIFWILAALGIGRPPGWVLVLVGTIFKPDKDEPEHTAVTVLRGVVAHAVIVAVLGLVFALVAPFLPAIIPLWIWGIVWGMLIFLADIVGVLRLIMPSMLARFSMPLFFVSHLIYGGVLGWWLQIGKY